MVDELKEKIIKIISEEDSSIQIYLLLKINGKYELRLADIEDDSSQELFDLFAYGIENTIVNNSELSIRSLSKDDEVNNALYLYDYQDYPEELKIIREFKIEEAINASKFDFKKDSLSDLFGFIIYIGVMTNGLTLFKKHYPIALIKRESFLLGLKQSNKRFEKISHDDVLRLNDSWHLLNLDNQLYISDLNVLEKNLGFTELIRKGAEETITEIEKLEILENIETLSEEVENLSFARKLARIKKSSAVFRKGVPSETIINFSKNTPRLAGKFSYSESGKIILSTKKQKKAFLQLLNDDFLHSELTAEYYAANSKDMLD